MTDKRSDCSSWKHRCQLSAFEGHDEHGDEEFVGSKTDARAWIVQKPRVLI